MSVIENPTSSQSIGSFNGIPYVRHRGRFAGQTVSGPFAVPYEIVVPANPAQGNGTMVFEPPHFASGPIVRDVILGPGFLFNRAFLHGCVGYGNFGFRSLNPAPGFPLKIRGHDVPVVFPGQPGTLVTDDNILRQFAYTVRNTPPAFLGAVARIYGIGSSDSGSTVHRVYEPFGQKFFDLSIPCGAGYVAPVNGTNPLMVFNAEADFDVRTAPDPAFPNRVCYAVPGAPHIPDTRRTRMAFPDPPPQFSPAPAVAGTTPLSWVPFLKALFVAGDEWVRNRRPPPPSTVLQVGSGGIIVRDTLGNARGGIRHPAVAMREARFFASVVRGPAWQLFGGYGSPVQMPDFEAYKAGFRSATEELVRARLLLRTDANAFIQAAEMSPPHTYTMNYAFNRFVPTRTQADEDDLLPLTAPMALTDASLKEAI